LYACRLSGAVVSNVRRWGDSISLVLRQMALVVGCSRYLCFSRDIVVAIVSFPVFPDAAIYAHLEDVVVVSRRCRLADVLLYLIASVIL
jgi:hypothetical protein